MTIITNVLDVTGAVKDLTVSDGNDLVIDGTQLLKIPSPVDPHVHFRVPGFEHKEDWVTGSKAAFYGGYTTVFDMPNTKPATNTYARFIDKKSLIDQQIHQSGFPLKYKLFFGADKNNFHQIYQVKDEIVGIKVFMGSSTGDLLLDDQSSLHAIYAIAKAFNLIIALHAEDELIISTNAEKYKTATDFKYHSIIREPEAARKAVELVIELSKIYDVTSYILHVSTRAEVDLIRNAKQMGVKVFAETCPHYLFLNEQMYSTLLGKLKMNPPVRSMMDQEYLWQAVVDGTIDTIASDHAPHTLSEKATPLCKCPSGIPGIETTLPLLFTAYKQNKITLARIVELVYTNPNRIFNLPEVDDYTLVNITKYRVLEDQMLHTKVGWSPYTGMSLTGYPEYIYTNNCLYLLK